MLQVTYCFVNKYEVNTKLSLYDNTNYFLQELKSVCNKIQERYMMHVTNCVLNSYEVNVKLFLSDKHKTRLGSG